MDTLRRVGSIRKSMRKQRKPSLTTEPAPGTDLEVASSHEGPELQPSYFTLTCSDAVVTASTGSFQPTHLRLNITRHRKIYFSNPVLWEPSLKCHLTGAGVWHPPFVVSVSVSPPMRSKSKGTLRHKDAFVSLENVDLKGRKKLLAKARVNLSDYYVAASVSPVAFKLKLLPETGKISGAFVHFSVHRTETDPANLSLPVERDEDEEFDVSPNNTLRTDKRASPISSHYDEDDSQSDEEYDYEKSPKFPKRESSPLASIPRPSSLSLKNTITVDQPRKTENNNDNTRSSTTTSSHIFKSSTYRTSTDSTATRTTTAYQSVKAVEKSSVIEKREPEVDRNRLLAEPEDFEIDTPKKVVVSGIVLPTGPPPPLPQRSSTSSNSKSPLPSLRNEKTTDHLPPTLVEEKQDVAAVSSPTKIESPVRIVEPKKVTEEFQLPKKPQTPVVAESPIKPSFVAESPFKVPQTAIKNTGLKPEPPQTYNDESPSQSISLSLGCPSPKLTPYKQSSVEKDLLDWAKKSLTSYPQIKVTNLSSSWRNGLGYCALLYEKYPQLVPMNSLKMHNLKDNCELAFDVGRLVGVDTSILVEDLTDNSVPDKAAVMAFLRELRSVLSMPEPVEVSPESVTEFQLNWFRKCGYFAKEVAHIVQAEEELEASRVQEEKEVREEQEKVEEEENRAAEDERRPGRDRVREMIAAAHREASNGNADESDDVMVVGRKLRESKTISEEMSKLAMEEARIGREQDKLERILRDEKTSEKAMEAGMKRLMQLVNEKNSLVRRQMQLNIAEQEKAISHELEEIQWRLQKYTDMEDSQKTESVRREEQALLDQLLEAVNKKNELVLHLDNQEKAIAEDERIQTMVANKDLITLKKEEECVIQ